LDIWLPSFCCTSDGSIPVIVRVPGSISIGIQNYHLQPNGKIAAL
jgi:hypothetical protein